MAYKIGLYPERWDTLKDLSFEDKGKILECIFEYDRIRSIPFDGHIAIIFGFLKNRLDHDRLKYEEKCQKNKEISYEYWKKKKNRTDTEGISKDKQTISNSNSNSNIISKDIINIPPEKSGGDKKKENEYTAAFEIFWKNFPHARKGKKKESFDYYKKLNADDIALEVNNLNRSIKFGLQDGNYIPACERWIRDFTQLSDLIKEQNIKTYVFRLMEMSVGDKRKGYYSGLCNDFGKDIIDKYVNQWNSERNGITLNLK